MLGLSEWLHYGWQKALKNKEDFTEQSLIQNKVWETFLYMLYKYLQYAQQWHVDGQVSGPSQY